VPLYDQNLSTLKLALQGEITTAMPNNGFSVVLYDTSGGFNSLTFNYTWGQFTSVGVTQTILASSPAESGLFNGTVGYYAIEVGGGPTDTINAQFDSLTAVPEPSTYAMFGFGLAMLFFVYRRKVGQA
jgi:hypothetical protein